MRKIIDAMIAFLTFDYYVDFDSIFRRLKKVHESHKLVWGSWPVKSTRRKLLIDFWYHAILHYLSLLGLCATIVILLNNHVSKYYLYTIAIGGLISYIPLYAMLYRPIFYGQFIPQLDNAIAEFEGQEKAWLEKCKQEQLSTRGLVLLYYILDKCAEINFLTPSDKSASLLLKIFGVSQKGLKNELDLLFKKEKRAKIEQRKQTEITKSFEEVYAILEEMQFPRGVQMLKEIEIRFNRPE